MAALLGPRAILVVHRSLRTLNHYGRSLLSTKFRFVKRYSIAVGQPGLETPAGIYLIHDKSQHPSYTYPDSDWVEPPELRGKKIPFGDPANPIAGRWMGLGYEGVGIHGTYADDSIGTAASHGCIRMHEDDVIELFPQVPKWSPVFIY